MSNLIDNIVIDIEQVHASDLQAMDVVKVNLAWDVFDEPKIEWLRVNDIILSDDSLSVHIILFNSMTNDMVEHDVTWDCLVWRYVLPGRP